MFIREVEEQDFEQLAELCLSFFSEHNIFSLGKDVTVAYLRKQFLEEDLFLVCENEGNIVGGVVLVLQGKTMDGTHARWKLRHLVWRSTEVAHSLITEGEKQIIEKSATAKIEIYLAENEKGLKLYTELGYTEEGQLLNHYRFGETCVVLGKSFKE